MAKSYITIDTLYRGVGDKAESVPAGESVTAKQLGISEADAEALVARGALRAAEAGDKADKADQGDKPAGGE